MKPIKRITELPTSMEDMDVTLNVDGIFNKTVGAIWGRTTSGSYLVIVPTGSHYLLEVEEEEFTWLAGREEEYYEFGV